MDWSQLQGPFLAGLSVVITGLCTWLTARIVAWLNAKISDKKAANFAGALTKIIMSAVQNVFQTYVEALKKDNAFTKEAQQEALNKCLAIIHTQLTPELVEYIQTNFGDVEPYLISSVEAMIYSLKK